MERSTSETHGARVAFRYPNFRLFMAARFLSIVSSEMISVAVGWQIYGLTHRPLDLGLVGLAQFAPGILLFLAAGHTADKHSRATILRVCNAAFAICALTMLVLSISRVSSAWPSMRYCLPMERYGHSWDQRVRRSCRSWLRPNISRTR